MTYRLILASRSPRRRELLVNAGFAPVVRPAAVVEERRPAEHPCDYVARLAREKCFAVAAADEEIVLAADTTVEVDGVVLEKPLDADDARRMLEMLSGRAHQVHTGFCARHGNKEIGGVVSTTVHFRVLRADEISDYVASGEPMDKAGGYGIQGVASRFVTRIDGCYFNVVGLPVAAVADAIREISHRSAGASLASNR